MDRWEDIIRRTAQSLLAARPPAAGTPTPLDDATAPNGPRIDSDVGLAVRPDIDDAVWRHRRPTGS